MAPLGSGDMPGRTYGQARAGPPNGGRQPSRGHRAAISGVLSGNEDHETAAKSLPPKGPRSPRRARSRKEALQPAVRHRLGSPASADALVVPKEGRVRPWSVFSAFTIRVI